MTIDQIDIAQRFGIDGFVFEDGRTATLDEVRRSMLNPSDHYQVVTHDDPRAIRPMPDSMIVIEDGVEGILTPEGFRSLASLEEEMQELSDEHERPH